jgi:hypothetical protein
MSDPVGLEPSDPNAVRAGDGRAAGSSRSRFLARAAVAGGALLGGGAAWVAPRLSTAAPSPTRDREALRLLLLVEHA